MTVAYWRSVMGVMELYADGGPEVDFLITEGESDIARARNNMVATFLNQTNYDTLAFIDADIEFQAEDFQKLADMDGVRGAAVAMKTPDFSEYLSCWRAGACVRRAEMPDHPFEVDFLGAAVMFIDREVLHKIRHSFPPFIDPVYGEGYMFFSDSVVGGTYLTEDYTFCHMLKQTGVPIRCHPDVVVSHHGPGVWRY